MIDGVEVKKLEMALGTRGVDMEILREDEPFFNRFGQLYMSSLYPGTIRGWHLHKRKHDYLACLRGMIKLVLHDARQDSPTYGEVNELFVGEFNPLLVHVPPGVHHGMKCISHYEALMINCPSEPRCAENPDEFGEPVDGSTIPYDWEIKFH